MSTLEAAPLHEAEFFLEQLETRKLHLGAIVLNKVLPVVLPRRGVGPSWRNCVTDSGERRSPKVVATTEEDDG